MIILITIKLVGGFNHLEKYESQWEGLSHLLWKINNVPNHQPVVLSYVIVAGEDQATIIEQMKIVNSS
jgi:hypothetical protein